MKIIYLHQYFNTPKDNGSIRSFQIAKSLVDHGYHVKMITGKRKGDLKYNNIEGIDVEYLPVGYNHGMNYIKRVLGFVHFTFLAIFRTLKEKDIDLIIATSTPLTISIPAICRRLIYGTPYIFEVRDVWPEAPIAIGAIRNKLLMKIAYALERYSYRYAKWIVPLSEDMQSSIVDRYPNVQNRIPEIITNISDVKLFGSKKKPNTLKKLLGFNPRFSVLYAGTFGKVNGLEYVVELAKRLLSKDQSIVFLLVGADKHQSGLLQKSIETGTYNVNVFFIDPVSKENLPELYQSVTMGSSFVTNIEELWANSANKYFDTLAAAKPILINYYGWQAREIENENIGYVLNPKIEQVDLDGFIKFSYNAKLLLSQGEKSGTIARQKYSLEIAERKYLELVTTATKRIL